MDEATLERRLRAVLRAQVRAADKDCPIGAGTLEALLEEFIERVMKKEA